jgi:hypothetical protein
MSTGRSCGSAQRNVSMYSACCVGSSAGLPGWRLRIVRASSRCTPSHAAGSLVPHISAYAGSCDWPGWIFTGLVMSRAISSALSTSPRSRASRRYSKSCAARRSHFSCTDATGSSTPNQCPG